MTNKKSIKGAMIASVIALLLCFTMLLGTTFAWFTDSVDSARNIIVSGNLDAVLEVGTPKAGVAGDDLLNPNNWDWTAVDSATKLFDEDARWEPGYVESVALRVRNNGTLSFKYSFGTHVYNETTGVNVAGDSFALSNLIKAISLPDTKYSFGSRETLMGIAQNTVDVAGLNGVMAKIGDEMVTDRVLNAGEAHYFTLAMVMPTAVGNEANHNGTFVPSVEFGVNLVATQYTTESDSYGNDYDKDADYVAYYTSGTHELNAVLKATKATDVITAEGAETVVNIRGGIYDAGNQECAVWAKNGATVNIYDGTFTHNGNGSEATSADHLDMIYAGANGGKINIYGGTFYAKSAGVWLLNEKDNQGEIVVYGGSFLNWNPANNVSEGANTSFVAAGYKVESKTVGGDTWYTVVPE